MVDKMTFPDTLEEFVEQYKIVDTYGIYMSKGSELVPIFRIKQWCDHIIKCKNCKYSGRSGYWCALHNTEIGPEVFCNYGEEREE